MTANDSKEPSSRAMTALFNPRIASRKTESRLDRQDLLQIQYFPIQEIGSKNIGIR